ncbi:MAG TPA: SAP domain-containing protein [Pseudonocardiaceae bacterium]
MALWICTNDEVAYSVGAPRCPECGSTEYVEQGSEEHEMAKSTRLGGVSNQQAEQPRVVTAPPQDGDATPVGALGPARDGDPAGVVQPMGDRLVGEHGPEIVDLPPGTVVTPGGALPPAEDDGPERVDAGDGQPREGVEAPTDGTEREHELGDDGYDGYDAMKGDALRAEAAQRGLPTSGTVAELRARLREDDQANARPADAEGADGTEHS